MERYIKEVHKILLKLYSENNKIQALDEQIESGRKTLRLLGLRVSEDPWGECESRPA